MRPTRTHKSLGLNPPPSAEAQLILRALLIGAGMKEQLRKAVEYSSHEPVNQVPIDYLKRSIAHLGRRVYNCARKHKFRIKCKDLAQPTRWAVFVSSSPLSPSRDGRKLLSAHRALDTLKVDPPHIGR